jgi:hypothetical protein
MINILYFEIIKTAKEAILKPYNEELTDIFFKCCNKLGTHQAFIEKHIDLYRDIITSFKMNRKFDDEKI